MEKEQTYKHFQNISKDILFDLEVNKGKSLQEIVNSLVILLDKNFGQFYEKEEEDLDYLRNNLKEHFGQHYGIVGDPVINQYQPVYLIDGKLTTKPATNNPVNNPLFPSLN